MDIIELIEQLGNDIESIKYDSDLGYWTVKYRHESPDEHILTENLEDFLIMS